MPSEKILFTKEDETHHQMIDLGKFRVGYFLARNRTKEDGNEDALFIRQKDSKIILGVSDGAGGHPKGEEAAAITAQGILENDKSWTHFLRLIEKVNDDILNLKVGARSTLITAYLEEDDLRIFSVGDSEALYWNASGEEVYSNIPQSPVGYLVQAEAIKQEQSLDEPERYIVDNMLGDQAIRIEATSKMELKKGHTLLLGTDGLFDNLTHAQLKEMLATGSFEKSFSALVEICLSQDPAIWKKDDDIAFIVVRKIKS